MAYDFDQADPEERTGLYADPRAPEEEPHSGRLLRVTGALFVMGIFAGGLWFAYTQGLRHSGSADSGEVPLVRADASPFKVKPANPGGMQIPDRDMLIYGEQHPQIEHLLPPPEQPMARPMPPAPPQPPKEAENSTSSASASQPEQASPRPAPPPPSVPPSSAPPQQTLAGVAAATPGAAPEQARSNLAPLSPSGLQEPQPQLPSAAVAQPAVPQHVNSETGLSAPSGRSPPAPDLIGQKIEQLEAAAAASRAKRADTGRAGGLRLQFGALRSESEARLAWERLKRSNTDLLGNLSGAPVRADLGGKAIYYRIETGPVGDPATAARVCDELRQRHLACTVVR